MNRLLILIATCAIFLSPANGQGGKCGTDVSQAQVTFENSINLSPIKPNESVPIANTELSVSVYIVKNDAGQDGITLAAINSAFDKLNSAFAPIKLKFRICNTNYVNNYLFNNINVLQNLKDLTVQFTTQKNINLYFVSDLANKDGDLVPGFTYMPAELKDIVVMDKDYISGNDLIHQFGHFLGLYHTHETALGSELVYDAECNKTGDKCCDTPADPSISGNIDDKCDYTGNAKDSKNNFYIPTTNNYMSLGNDNCRCVFTKDQLNRAVYILQNHKKHLW